MSSADYQAHTVVADALPQPSGSAATSPSSVAPAAAAGSKNPKSEALQRARDKMLGIYYLYVKDAYFKSMQPKVQQWPSPAIPPSFSENSSEASGLPVPPPQQPCGTILKDLYAHCHLSWDIYNGPAFFAEQLKRHHPTFQLLFMTEDSDVRDKENEKKNHPNYCIIADSAAKEVVVVIRGTKDSRDIATDGKINLVSFPDGVLLPVDVLSNKPPARDPPPSAQSAAADATLPPLFVETSTCFGVYETAWCHEGIFKSAKSILDGGLRGWAQSFLKSGFRIRLCGHSLGAGVAVIISLLLRQLPHFQQQPRRLQTFVMSPPACVSESLARSELCLQVYLVFHIACIRSNPLLFHSDKSRFMSCQLCRPKT